ncbi:MAG: DUF4174 domain-containing protein [Rhodothermaceae bacterium]|nr:DUF4174 domain-containing protein [Rhodothermaceae bacterium]
MHLLFGILVLCILSTCASPSMAQDKGSFDLNEYRWKNRLLVVFAEQEATPAYQTLATEIKSLRAEFEDRNMVLISAFEDGKGTAAERALSSEDVDQLRETFGVNPGSYRAYLIGKDGGIKREGGPEIRLQDVFSLIDTMPMRRSEMRQKASKKDSNG